MTRTQAGLILDRLEEIEKSLSKIEIELAETRGGIKVLRAIAAFLGVSGIGAILAWLSAQGK
jgi:hypothetical protein